MQPRGLALATLCLLVVLREGAGALAGDPRLLARLQHLLGVVEQLSRLAPHLDPEDLPAPQDVRSHCERSAFSCFQTVQLKPAGSGGKQKSIQNFAKQLRRKLPGSRAQEEWRTCPSCDSYERKPPQEFLARLKALLQQMLHRRLS
ncbi:interleukin-21 [Erinaceus europaeus]|uniref:Interleukin-21 n=1 Tax=Erinaceus europaeus TaxID=9365 RepID=A0A1S3WTH1_ERIEU|nr:interleukin-21 [Erinaceus europaeus]